MSDIVLAILLGIAAAIAFGFVPFFARLGLVHLRTNTGVLISMLAGLFVVGLFAVPLHIHDMFAISMLTLLGSSFLASLTIDLAGSSTTPQCDSLVWPGPVLSSPQLHSGQRWPPLFSWERPPMWPPCLVQ